MAKILLFGPLSDILGTEAITLDITADISTVSDLLIHLQQRGPAWKKYLVAANLQITVNRQFCEPGHTISNTDEIALIPLPGTI